MSLFRENTLSHFTQINMLNTYDTANSCEIQRENREAGKLAFMYSDYASKKLKK